MTKLMLAAGLLFSMGSASALPIDWGGSFAFDTTLLSKFRRTGDDITNNTPAGTQGIASGDDGAHFQTYIFKLNPHMVVNDAVSIKGEFSSGHTRGGFAGDDSAQSQDRDAGSNAYYSTVPAQRSSLNVNQLYAELYADTAMVKVGRFAKHFGSGAILNAGTGAFDRFFTQYDGVQGEMRIGNFALVPHWAKLASYSAANDRAEANGSRDVREMGITAAYDNKNTGMNIALVYAKRFSERQNEILYSGNANPRGSTDVTLLDAFIEKKWEKWNLKIEVPTLAGDYGDVYGNGDDSRISSSAVLVDTKWVPNARWALGLHAGQIGGDKGKTQRFEGMALNPNYHVAELMFRYNYPAFNEGNNSIFDAHMSNVRFFKLHAHYTSDKWTWNAAAIMASAMQTAKAGQDAYHHEEGYRFAAVEKQDDDYGTEINAGFDYLWNPNVKLSAFIAYWLVGDYYAFDNDADEEISLDNVMGSGLRLAVEF